jgi:hypothetical protein
MIRWADLALWFFGVLVSLTLVVVHESRTNSSRFGSTLWLLLGIAVSGAWIRWIKRGEMSRRTVLELVGYATATVMLVELHHRAQAHTKYGPWATGLLLLVVVGL